MSNHGKTAKESCVAAAMAEFTKAIKAKEAAIAEKACAQKAYAAAAAAASTAYESLKRAEAASVEAEKVVDCAIDRAEAAKFPV